MNIIKVLYDSLPVAQSMIYLLLSLSFTDWAQRLRFINTGQVVQEYPPSTCTAIVPYQSMNNSMCPIYSTRWSNNQSNIRTICGPLPTPPEAQSLLGAMFASIEYPIVSSLKQDRTVHAK